MDSEIVTYGKNLTHFNDEKGHWYVLTTKPKFEKKVNQGLCKFNIINYLPLQKYRREIMESLPTFFGHAILLTFFVMVNN